MSMAESLVKYGLTIWGNTTNTEKNPNGSKCNYIVIPNIYRDMVP